jgi:hypothetical protein
MKAMNRTRILTIGWWVTWGVFFVHLLLLPSLIGASISDGQGSNFGWRIVVVLSPLATSVGIRWLFLTRVKSRVIAFVLFLIGLILADMNGLMAVFLNLPFRRVLYWLCVIGVAQFFPRFLLPGKVGRGPIREGQVEER